MQTVSPQNPDFRCGFVAIIGRPNVGKSTFLNRMIGERMAAVSPKAQTTRRRFRGIKTEDSYQMIFVDTPGVHRAPQGKMLNEYCVSEALDAIEDTDAFVYIVDGSRELKLDDPESDEVFLISQLQRVLKKRAVPLFLVLNKMDLWEKGKNKFSEQKGFEDLISRLPVKAVYPLSARTGDGVDPLVAELIQTLPTGPAFFPLDELTDQSMRQVAGELIQEQLFHVLGDEIPYSCAVEIVSYKDPTEGKRLTEIEANIHVERESQKSMVIGKGGAKIKEIGQSARESIERLMNEKIVLRLQVKHSPKWTKDLEQLKRLGYTVPERR